MHQNIVQVSSDIWQLQTRNVNGRPHPGQVHTCRLDDGDDARQQWWAIPQNCFMVTSRFGNMFGTAESAGDKMGVDRVTSTDEAVFEGLVLKLDADWSAGTWGWLPAWSGGLLDRVTDRDQDHACGSCHHECVCQDSGPNRVLVRFWAAVFLCWAVYLEVTE